MKAIALVLALVGCGGSEYAVERHDKAPVEYAADCDNGLASPEEAECIVARGRFKLSTIEPTGCELHYYEYSCLALQTDGYLQGEFEIEVVPREANGTCNLCDGNVAVYR